MPSINKVHPHAHEAVFVSLQDLEDDFQSVCL